MRLVKEIFKKNKIINNFKMNNGNIIEMLVKGQRDLAWFEANINILKNKFNNKFIAFNNENIIDADSNLDNLIGKLKNKNIDMSNVFIKFVSKVKTIF